MKPKFDLWLEKNGRIILNRRRASLLRAIHETGSISEAARCLHIQYRVAWAQIHAAESVLGRKLVQTSMGGAQRGGTRLTKAGRSAVEQFEQFTDGFEEYVGRRFGQAYESSLESPEAKRRV